MNNSVAKAIDLLEELSRSKKPAALKDLARNTSLNKATAYRLLYSLCQRGLVHKSADGVYGLGPKLLVFAEEYRRNFTMRDKVLPFLQQLVVTTGETAIYCERFGQDSCVTIERHESPHHTRTIIETGIPRPLYVGSSALAILAMLSQAEILAIIKMRRPEKFTPFTIVSPKELMKRIEQIKTTGYAVSIQERYLYTAGIAAPCFLGSNVIGSIAVIGPAERIRANGVEKTGKTVKRVAARLSAKFGYAQNLEQREEPGKRFRVAN